jgi:PIN domain nuclease of toxin-antitoxin system
VNGRLLDTHILLFLAFDRSRLSPTLVEELLDPALERYVSAVSAIEIAIKSSMGKLPLPPPFEIDFPTAFETLARRFSARLLPIELTAVARMKALPLHHRDPFDRLLIAQAMDGDLSLVSRDRHFHAYDGLKLIVA